MRVFIGTGVSIDPLIIARQPVSYEFDLVVSSVVADSSTIEVFHGSRGETHRCTLADLRAWLAHRDAQAEVATTPPPVIDEAPIPALEAPTTVEE